MIMLYFSGTGNSKYIAELFSEKIRVNCYSIEENIDFEKVIENHNTIAFCYPVYGSSVPRIMREFVSRNTQKLKHKKLIILCTQLMCSGDGARAFIELLPDGYGEVIYAEHFNMPNNICNNLKEGKVKKRGFNKFSKFLGNGQRKYWPQIEEKNKSSVKIDEDCINCNLCVNLYPMKNLTSSDKEILQNDNCIICYRCVNSCSKKAITVLIHKKPKKQYKGIS